MKRDSFIVYASFYEPISSLSDEQLGRLFRSLFKWRISGEENVEPDILMAFKFFIHQIEIDDERYMKKCEQNRDNIKNRWNKKNTNEYEGIQPNTKDTYNDNDNDNDKEKEKDNDKDNTLFVVADAPTPTKKRISFVAPSLEDVKAYALEIGAPEKEAIDCLDYYTSVGWVMSGGRKIKDWKAALRHWMNRADNHKKSSPSTSPTKSRTEIPKAKSGEFKDTLM